jgi:hypothetical protein
VKALLVDVPVWGITIDFPINLGNRHRSLILDFQHVTLAGLLNSGIEAGDSSLLPVSSGYSALGSSIGEGLLESLRDSCPKRFSIIGGSRGSIEMGPQMRYVRRKIFDVFREEYGLMKRF